MTQSSDTVLYTIYTLDRERRWAMTDCTTDVDEAVAIVSAALHCGEQLTITVASSREQRQCLPPVQRAA